MRKWHAQKYNEIIVSLCMKGRLGMSDKNQ